jgi:membrane protease YdiL (CAAX protease family)
MRHRPDPSPPAIPGDPISFAAANPALWPARTAKPSRGTDLDILWYWLHFVVFGVFAFVSLVIVQLTLLLRYAPLRSMSNQKEMERLFVSKPLLAIGTMVIWYALLILFLYVTLSVLRGTPFWRSVGWQRFDRRKSAWPTNPWLYFAGGCGLSILVFIATARIQAPEDVPIQELFKYKNTALMFMAMAVLVAPLVEETIFRGYLYPLFARTFTMLFTAIARLIARYSPQPEGSNYLPPNFAKFFGGAISIVLTGTLFGLMHGAQLGWTWALVLVLIAVGVVFTLVRALTGTVFASFLLHLGYNSTIAIVTILGTQGFTKFPSTH